MAERRVWSEKERAYIAEYDRNNTTMVSLHLVREKDADIIQELERSGNRQGYIKELIRRDIEKEKAGE